jgi:hypothetical protein
MPDMGESSSKAAERELATPKDAEVRSASSALLMIVVLACFVGMLLSFALVAKFTQSSGTHPRYGFENDESGWEQHTDERVKGCTHVVRSGRESYEGDYSLEATMDLDGGDDNRRTGEAIVDWRKVPLGDRAPGSVDLNDVTVTAWVYVPAGEGVYDPRKGSIGFHLFVKNKNGVGLYGPWAEAVEGEWCEISLTVCDSAPDSGDMSEGFDPHEIVELGVQMNVEGDSEQTFQGKVYVDRVDW